MADVVEIISSDEESSKNLKKQPAKVLTKKSSNNVKTTEGSFKNIKITAVNSLTSQSSMKPMVSNVQSRQGSVQQTNPTRVVINSRKLTEPQVQQQQQPAPSGFRIVSVAGNVKRLNSDVDGSSTTQPMIKRLKPTLISTKVSGKLEPAFGEDPLTTKSFMDFDKTEESEEVIIPDRIPDPKPNVTVNDVNDRPGSSASSEQTSSANPKTPINETFAELIKACQSADSSPAMQKLIDKRLIKYYQGAHPEFVNSRAFCKTVRATTTRITENPQMVYLSLQSIVEELDIRRKNYSAAVEGEEEAPTTGDPKTDIKLRKLTLALTKCEKKIKELEEAEVDFEDEHNSNYILAERYKTHACKIYNKICDLTGENKNANRAVLRPIKFKETNFREFNNAVQNWCNRTHEFPDYNDVYKLLDHCNSQYQYALNRDSMKAIAANAFRALGKILSHRRRADLYETAEYYGQQKDPAKDDPELLAKLESNRQMYSKKMEDVINQFAEDIHMASTSKKSQVNGSIEDSESETLKSSKSKSVTPNPSTSDPQSPHTPTPEPLSPPRQRSMSPEVSVPETPAFVNGNVAKDDYFAKLNPDENTPDDLFTDEL